MAAIRCGRWLLTMIVVASGTSCEGADHGSLQRTPYDGRDVHYGRVADKRQRHGYEAEPRGPKEQRDATYDAGYDDLSGAEIQQ